MWFFFVFVWIKLLLILLIYSFCDWFSDICYVLLMFDNLYFLILEIDEDSVGFINVLYYCLLIKFMDLIFFFWCNVRNMYFIK